jgi:Autographiviridae RNA polymerase
MTTLGDPDITAHPLWAREVQLEREMLCMGADLVRESTQRARQRGQLSTTRPVNRLLRDWLPQVAEGIKDWRRASIACRGAKPISLEYIQDADASLLALIALREILDSVGQRRARVMSMAVTIGTHAEHELKMQKWEASDKDAFKSVQHYFDREGSSDSHRATGNSALFTRAVVAGTVAWQPWSHEAHFRVGATLLDAIVRHTGWFTVEYATPEDGLAKGRGKGSPLLLVPNASLMEWLAEAFEAEELSRPRMGPTIIPPKPWEGNRGGGYWTPYVRGPRLIRFKAHQEEQRALASDEYDALDMPSIYQAVNFIQEVPWRINKRVLETVKACWLLDMGVGGLPAIEAAPLPPKPEDMDTNPEAQKEWRRAAKGTKRRNNSLVSKRQSALSIVQSANTYLTEDRIYFPHMLDFRGRMYSIPSGLSPQGHDLARGLLQFADTKPILTANGGRYWLALQVANMMGQDKRSNADRLAWVEERREEWLAVAADPVGQRAVWSGSKSPWQALAAILDWAGYLSEGEGYRSALPVTVDGTCNGLQHLSAILKDHEAAPLVNLVPSEAPADIYATIAAEWQAHLEAFIAQGEEVGQQAAFVLDLWGGVVPRSATKRQVMVLPYGGTRDAFYKYTVEAANEASPPPENMTIQAFTFRARALGMASRALWEIVNKRLPGAMAVMSWLQECSKLVVEGNQPIYWIVPSGFIVRHFYGKQKQGRVDLKLNGRMVRLVTQEVTKDLDAAAQTRGVPPNFVHSLDAAALTITCNRCEAEGITHLTGIHDAYGTHAADMNKLSGLLRDAFVEVHEQGPLDIFWQGCQDILEAIYRSHGASREGAAELAAKQRPPLPAFGTLDIRDVLRSPYFFS